MSDANASSTPQTTPAIHRELDRLRSVDWTERPASVESPLGTLRCDYDEDLGTSGWICLNGIVDPPSPLLATPAAAPRHQVRIWIPQARRR